MNIQANDRKQINTAVLDHLFTQGEAGADVVSIHLPLRYGQADLAALVWSVQLVSEKDSFVSKALEKEVAEEELILRWMVDEDCTAVSGKVSVTVVGVSEDGGTVIKFDGNRIFIKEAAYGSFAPAPDTMAAALLQVQKAAEEAASAAKSANEDAQAAQESASRSPYIGEDGFWYVFDGESGMYQKSDIAAAGPAGPAGPKGDPGGVLTVNGQAPDGNGNVNVQAGVRPNLLDNWYFGNPVNQRGQTEYTGVGYGIDRWRATAQSGKVLLLENAVRVSTSNDSTPGWFCQILENPTAFSGKTVTFSMLVTTQDASSWRIAFEDATTAGGSGNYAIEDFELAAGETALISVTKKIDVGVAVSLLQNRDSTEKYVDILAAKLELGEGQTLAHQDADGNWVLNEIPDYAEELAKCQRYYQKITGGVYAAISTSTTNLRFFVPTPVSMRANPAISGTLTGQAIYSNDDVLSNVTLSGVSTQLLNTSGVYVSANSSSNLAAYRAYNFCLINDLVLDANL